MRGPGEACTGRRRNRQFQRSEWRPDDQTSACGASARCWQRTVGRLRAVRRERPPIPTCLSAVAVRARRTACDHAADGVAVQGWGTPTTTSSDQLRELMLPVEPTPPEELTSSGSRRTCEVIPHTLLSYRAFGASRALRLCGCAPELDRPREPRGRGVESLRVRLSDGWPAAGSPTDPACPRRRAGRVPAWTAPRPRPASSCQCFLCPFLACLPYFCFA